MSRSSRPVRLVDNGASAPEPRPSVVADSYPRRDFVVRRLLAIVDVLAIGTALAFSLRFGDQWQIQPLDRLLWLIPLLPVWLLLFKLYNLYDRDVKRVNHTTVDDLPWLFHALVIGTLLMWTYYAFIPPLSTELSFQELLIFGPLALVLVTIGRVTVRHGADRIVGPERAAFIGHDANVSLLVRKVRSHPEYGLDPVGLLRLPGQQVPDGEPHLRVLGSTEDLRELVHLHDLERVIVASSQVDGAQLLELLRDCQALALKVSILPELFDALGPSVELDDVEGVTVLGINPPVLSRTSRWLKRCMDVAGATVGLLLALPVMVAIAIAIKLDSRGPVFFRQTRIGKGGKRFELRKFRTMVVDAESLREELQEKSLDPDWLHLEHDPRITRVGRFLRHTSLDELPQLVHVVTGLMSLVGPRPLIESEDERIRGWRRTRLDLTPGLTGSWQVLGRTQIPFEEMVKLDYLYVTNWSLWTDVRLILRTLPVVLARRGAN